MSLHQASSVVPSSEGENGRELFELLLRWVEPTWHTDGRDHGISADGWRPEPGDDPPYNWSPLCETNPKLAITSPALPFPFTPHQLAALMIDGHGAVWCEQLGGWAGEPELSFPDGDRSDPKLKTHRDAVLSLLKATWDAYRLVDGVAGGPELDDAVLAGWHRPLDPAARKRAEEHWAPRRRWLVAQLLADEKTQAMQCRSQVRDNSESPTERRVRRLARFSELGGEMHRAGESWQCRGKRGALAALEREERAAGNPMSVKTNIRQDLHKAMEDRRGS
jgi:hypothetical protein